MENLYSPVFPLFTQAYVMFMDTILIFFHFVKLSSLFCDWVDSDVLV